MAVIFQMKRTLADILNFKSCIKIKKLAFIAN